MTFLSFVKDHGAWSLYMPDPRPESIPSIITFARRDGSGEDWYRYLSSGAFQTDTLKFIVALSNGVRRVLTVARDQRKLFPQDGQIVVEFDDGLTIDVEPWAYTGWIYDPATQSLIDVPQVRLIATARQVRLALNHLGLRQAIEDYVALQGDDVQDSWEYSTEFDADHPFIVAGKAALGITDEQVSALFELARTL